MRRQGDVEIVVEVGQAAPATRCGSGWHLPATARRLRRGSERRSGYHVSHVNVVAFTAVVFAGSLVAGFLGSLTGLGGGVVIVPLLTVALGVDVRYATGASRSR